MTEEKSSLMLGYKSYALREFMLAGMMPALDEYADDKTEMTCEDVFKILDILSSHRRSLDEAKLIMNIVHRLSAYVPLSPLLCDDPEWVDYNDNPDISAYNNRLTDVFKLSTGEPVFTKAIRYVGPDGEAYIGAAQTENGSVVPSAQRIKTIPFEPISIVVSVYYGEQHSDGVISEVNEYGDDTLLIICDESELDEVKEIYNFSYNLMGDNED